MRESSLHYSQIKVVKFVKAGWFVGWMQARVQAFGGQATPH